MHFHFSCPLYLHIMLSRSCGLIEMTENYGATFRLGGLPLRGSRWDEIHLDRGHLFTQCSVIADKQKVFDLNHYTIRLVCLFKNHHTRGWLLVTVRKTSAFFQSIPQERTTVICLRPFCLSEMFNFLAHNGSCTLGKQPLLACLFGRRGSLWIWPGFQMTTHTREMKGWKERGGESKEETGEEDPIYFE